VLTRAYDGKYIDPDAFLAQATRKDGSWWPEWEAWLDARSGDLVPPPALGAPAQGYAPLADAPGTYVLEK
jgi:polyhydroxyalkanoate synthase